MATSADVWVPELDTEIWDEYPTWTSANAGEILPGVLTPLTISTILETADHGFLYLLDDVLGLAERLGIDGTRRHYCIGSFFGRAHLNLSLLREGADLIPGTSAEALDEQYLGKARDPNATPKVLSKADEALSLEVGARFEAAVPAHIQQTIEHESDVAAYFAAHLKRDLSAFSDEELLILFDETLGRARRSAELHLFNRAMESPALEGLAQFVETVRGEADSALVATLCTGLADVESAKPAYGIWRLSRQVIESDDLSALLASAKATEITTALADPESEDRRALAEALGAFLTEYGYRGERELELSMPSWRHDPSFVISAIQAFAKMEAGGPEAIAERQAAAREAARSSFEEPLPAETRTQFAAVLQLAHTFLVLGERTKSQLVRDVSCGKDIVRELASRLDRLESIAAPDDVFFLTLGELQSLVRSPQTAGDLGQTIVRRREDYLRQEEIELPEWFDGRPEVVTDVASSEEITELSGIPVSPGVVTGRARVIMSVAQDTYIEEGEILVAPYTDAPWTPLFIPAAALICDLGGPLSHGSVVAREYGIPAVTNTKQGTAVIRTGDTVTVDGAAGTVLIDRG